MAITEDELNEFREHLSCGFGELDTAFAGCMEEAQTLLSPQGVTAYLDGASLICKIGRGYAPVLEYLEEMPRVAHTLGEETLELVSKTVWIMSRSPNGAAIHPFLVTVKEAARRLGSEELLREYIDVLLEMMERTTGSIHGFHTTIPSPGLPVLLEQVPYLLNQLSLEGFARWVDYGVNHYLENPDRQKEYFSVETPDSRAILQRERHGTLFADNERKLDLYFKSLWDMKDHFVPYSTRSDDIQKAVPYFDSLGVRLPDVFDDLKTRSGAEIKGIDRYRAVLAHVAAHKRWSSQIVADNLSPFQRVAVETFEDCRVEALAIRRYPGLRTLFKTLHPVPREDACDPESESCIRHRLAMFSYAVLDPKHPYKNPHLLDFVDQFHALLAEGGEGSTADVSKLAISYIARTSAPGDRFPNIYFDDTEMDWRDDNRHLWIFIEEGDEEEMFDAEKTSQEDVSEIEGLPPRHYPEWDYHSKTYRPDWVSLYESLHPSGQAGDIDAILSKHAALAKRMRQILDMLKPQQHVRIRYQEDGSELDLDVAIRSLIDFKGGAAPDPRVNMSHRTDGRDIAVMLLIDLSQSIKDVPEGCDQSILELSREAVALLGWAIDRLGDEFAIAGFSSNTRHEVRYQHIKGYGESWNDEVKARLAAMEAGYSTRMGAALRHAAHYLGTRKADKKLLLVLTDGEPSDIDVTDHRLLVEDTHKAVQELDREGIYTHCVNLDDKADEYIGDIFGTRYTVIDNIDRLPEKLPQLFLSMTK